MSKGNSASQYGDGRSIGTEGHSGNSGFYFDDPNEMTKEEFAAYQKQLKGKLHEEMVQPVVRSGCVTFLVLLGLGAISVACWLAYLSMSGGLR